MKKIVLALCLLSVVLYADFNEGKKIFKERCSMCHKEYISFKELKVNFFERNNELLNLTVPTVNMLAWAIMDSSRKIGDPQEPDMRQIEIEEYLKEYLANPDIHNSICDQTALKYYIKKEPMTIADEKAEYLALFFMGYKEDRLKNNPEKKVALTTKKDDTSLLNEAKNSRRHIMVYATSETCYFCKKMDKEVLQDKEVIDALNEDYLFVKIDVDYEKLPLKLDRAFKGMTPTFFVVNKNGQLLNTYPGAWVKSDFFKIMKENIQ